LVSVIILSIEYDIGIILWVKKDGNIIKRGVENVSK